MFELKIEELIAKCKQYLLTKNDFVNSIYDILKDEDSPIENFLFVVDTEKPFKPIYIGSLSLKNSSPDHKTNILDDININTIKNIQMLIKLKEGRKFSSYVLFEKLFEAYWRKQLLRDPKTLLLPDADGDMPIILNNTINKALEDNKMCAVLYADIDGFKVINDTYNHETGDAVIAKIAMAIEESTYNSIPIHSHGDEFAILHMTNNIEEALLIANNIRTKIKNIIVDHKDAITNECEEITLETSLSFGMYIVDQNNYNIELKFPDYLKKAEEALVPSDGSGKRRGQIRIFETLDATEEVDDYSLKASLIQSKINLLHHRPFSNVWLTFISKYIRNLEDLKTVNLLQNSFDNIIKIIVPDLSKNNISNLTNSSINYSHSLSIIDIMLAFLNGVTLNNNFDTELKEVEIEYDVDNSRIKVSLKSSVIIEYSLIKATLFPEDCKIFIPSFPNIRNERYPMDGKISNSVLIYVGSEYNTVYHHIFNTVINVDNRPIIGGGLPDFWEAAIANLINSVSTNKNIKHVFVLGDASKETRTSSLLDEVNNNCVQDISYIAYKTGYDSSAVESIFKRLEGNIKFISDQKQLIEAVYEVEFSKDNAFDINDIDYAHVRQKKGYLKKEVNLEHFRLDELDGCRGESLRKIYPVVINNIREMELTLNTDFSNKSYKELVDYKIILTEPGKDIIPWFYEKDVESFKSYYKHNFLDSEGTFYNKLNANNQVEIVIDHIVENLKNSHNHKVINTRRAIIILDNNIKEEKLDPVGLVAIRIFYDFSKDGAINMNFTYIWRTVEVIVGLPYSMYGSISYSQFLLSKILEKLQAQENVAINIKKIQFGTLTYIAQSLHMFKDSYSDNIAKNIVDEATI